MGAGVAGEHRARWCASLVVVRQRLLAHQQAARRDARGWRKDDASKTVERRVFKQLRRKYAAELKQIEALFKLFDTAGNSLIDRDDLKRAYVKLGYLCTDDKAIDKHLAQLDLSGDGGEYGIDFNQFALGILNGNSFIFKALYSFDDKAAVEQIPGLGLSAAAVNPLRSASGSILEDDDAAPTSQGVDDVEAEDGEDGGLETQKDAVTEETMPEDAPNGAK